PKPRRRLRRDADRGRPLPPCHAGARGAPGRALLPPVRRTARGCGPVPGLALLVPGPGRLACRTTRDGGCSSTVGARVGVSPAWCARGGLKRSPVRTARQRLGGRGGGGGGGGVLGVGRGLPRPGVLGAGAACVDPGTGSGNRVGSVGVCT